MKQSEWEWHGRPKRQVFAVLRIDDFKESDLPVDEVHGPHHLSVTAVLPTQQDAIDEVQRLNAANADKDCRYYWVATRYYPEGRRVIDESRETSG